MYVSLHQHTNIFILGIILFSKISMVLMRSSKYKYISHQAPYSRYYKNEDDNADARSAAAYDVAEEQYREKDLVPRSRHSPYQTDNDQFSNHYYHRGYQTYRNENEPDQFAERKSLINFSSDSRKRDDTDRRTDSDILGEDEEEVDQNCNSKDLEDSGDHGIYKFNKDSTHANGKAMNLANEVPRFKIQHSENTKKDKEYGVQVKNNMGHEVEDSSMVKESDQVDNPDIAMEYDKVLKRHVDPILKRSSYVQEQKKPIKENLKSSIESQNTDTQMNLKNENDFKDFKISNSYISDTSNKESAHDNADKNKCCPKYENCFSRVKDDSENEKMQKMDVKKHLKNLSKNQYQTLLDMLSPEDLKVLKEIENDDISDNFKREITKKSDAGSEQLIKSDKTIIKQIEEKDTVSGSTDFSKNEDLNESSNIDENENLKEDYNDKESSREIRSEHNMNNLKQGMNLENPKKEVQYKPNIALATEIKKKDHPNGKMKDKYEFLVQQNIDAIKYNIKRDSSSKLNDQPHQPNPITTQKTLISTSNLHNVGNRNGEIENQNSHTISKRYFSDNFMTNSLEGDSPPLNPELQRASKSRKLKIKNLEKQRNPYKEFSSRPIYNRDYRNDHVRDLEESFAGPSRNSRYWEEENDEDLQPLVRVKREPESYVRLPRHAAGIQPESRVAFVPYSANEDEDIAEGGELEYDGFGDSTANLEKQHYEPEQYERSPEYAASKIVAEFDSEADHLAFEQPNDKYRSLHSRHRYKNIDKTRIDKNDLDSKNKNEFSHDSKYLRRNSNIDLNSNNVEPGVEEVDDKFMYSDSSFRRDRRNALTSVTPKIEYDLNTSKVNNKIKTQNVNSTKSLKQEQQSLKIRKINKPFV